MSTLLKQKTEVTENYDYTKMTMKEFEHIKKCLTNKSKASCFSKVTYILNKDGQYTLDDLINESIMKAIETAKRKKLTFKVFYQFSSFVIKTFDFYVKRLERDLTHIKKKNAFIVNFDSPAHTSSDFTSQDANTTTVGDILSLEMQQQVNDVCYDMLSILRENWLLCFTTKYSRKLNIKYVDASSTVSVKDLSALKDTDDSCMLISMRDLVLDIYRLNYRELVDKYNKFEIYLNKKMIDNIMLEIKTAFDISLV